MQVEAVRGVEVCLVWGSGKIHPETRLRVVRRGMAPNRADKARTHTENHCLYAKASAVGTAAAAAPETWDQHPELVLLRASRGAGSRDNIRFVGHYLTLGSIVSS